MDMDRFGTWKKQNVVLIFIICHFKQIFNLHKQIQKLLQYHVLKVRYISPHLSYVQVICLDCSCDLFKLFLDEMNHHSGNSSLFLQRPQREQLLDD